MNQIISLAKYRLTRERIAADPVQDEIALCRNLAAKLESLPPLVERSSVTQLFSEEEQIYHDGVAALQRIREGAAFDQLIEKIEGLLPPEPIPTGQRKKYNFTPAPRKNVSRLFSEEEERYHDAQAAFQRIRERVRRRGGSRR